MSLYVPCYRPYNKHNTNIHAPGGIFFSCPVFFPPFDPFCTFKSFRPSSCHLWSILVLIQQTQHKHPCLRRDFFFFGPGFFPFDPFLYCLNPFVHHVTLRSMLPSLQQTQHKHPCHGKRAAEDPRLRPHGHWDRPFLFVTWLNSVLILNVI
jgi:hypothetical protein